MTRWIVASSVWELNLLMAAAHAQPAGHTNGFPYFAGQLDNEPIKFGIARVGIVSAALALGGFLASERISQIVMVGSAGAFPSSELEIGDVAVATSETMAELGVCSDRGVADASPLRFLGVEQTVSLDEQLARQMTEAVKGSFALRMGPFLTVAGVSDSEGQAAARAARFRPLVENMEGYAVALAGQSVGIAVVEIRGVSNRAGNRDKATWNLDLANARSQELALAFCRQHPVRQEG